MWRQLVALLCLLCSGSLAFVINTNKSDTLLKHPGKLDAERYFCVSQQQWIAPGLRETDCLGTLESLHKVAREAKSEFFEFVASGIVPSHRHLKTVYTPVKFRTCEFSVACIKLFPLIEQFKATCTLAIQMISDAGDIPGKTTQGTVLTLSDIASFYDILGAAEELFVECIKEKNRAGWQSAGKST